MDASDVITHDIILSRSLITGFATCVVYVEKSDYGFGTIPVVTFDLSSFISFSCLLMLSTIFVSAPVITLVVLEYLPSLVD